MRLKTWKREQARRRLMRKHPEIGMRALYILANIYQEGANGYLLANAADLLREWGELYSHFGVDDLQDD